MFKINQKCTNLKKWSKEHCFWLIISFAMGLDYFWLINWLFNQILMIKRSKIEQILTFLIKNRLILIKMRSILIGFWHFPLNRIQKLERFHNPKLDSQFELDIPIWFRSPNSPKLTKDGTHNKVRWGLSWWTINLYRGRIALFCYIFYCVFGL